MADSQPFVLPEQELAVLRAAVQDPQFAPLFDSLPQFQAALARRVPAAGRYCVCGSKRYAECYSKACDCNFFSIPHLKFERNGYMPSGLGIPGGGDGPEIRICLDCGRARQAYGERVAYPISDETLAARIKADYDWEAR